MNEIFQSLIIISILFVVTIPITFISYLEIKRKKFTGFLLFPIVLLCLIALTFQVSQLMIDNTTLLQVNGTIIAGLLVLLSLNSIWVSNLKEPIKPKVAKIKKYGIYFTPTQILIIFVPYTLSSIFAILDSEFGNWRFFALGLSILGFVFILLVVCMIMFSERKQDLDFSDVS